MSQTNSLPSANAHFITLDAAIDLTTNLRAGRESILDSGYRNQDVIPCSETFNRNAFDTLLAKQDCAGIRLYYGMDENYKLHAVFVAVNDDNEDLLPATSTRESTDIVEEGQRCPDLCPPPSSLNN